MNFKISKSLFYSSLSVVNKAISLHSPIPALSGIKIDVSRNQIALTGSDSNISIRKTISNDDANNFEVFAEGSIVIDARYLLEIVRKIDSDILQIEIIDGSLTRFSGLATEYKINGIKSYEYPNIDFNIGKDSINFDADLFIELVNQTSFAASEKETRPVLTGVNFKNTADDLVVVATDSYRLAKKVIDFKIENEFDITIPARSLSDIAKIINEEEVVKMAISSNKVQFIVDSVIIQTRLIDGLYPDTTKLIPEEFVSELKIEAKDFLNALDRASLIKSEGVPVVKMNISTDELILSSSVQEIGSSTEKIDNFTYDGEPFEISFSGKLVFDAIRALNALEVEMKFTGDMKPIIIKSTFDENVTQLVLPIRTH